jgi:hypothetical protein
MSGGSRKLSSRSFTKLQRENGATALTGCELEWFGEDGRFTVTELDNQLRNSEHNTWKPRNGEWSPVVRIMQRWYLSHP